VVVVLVWCGGRLAVREVAAAFPPCGGLAAARGAPSYSHRPSTAVSAPPVRPQTLHPACPLLLPRGGVHTSSDKTESDRQILRPAPVIFRPEQQQEGGVAGR